MCYFITVGVAERAAAHLVGQRAEGLVVQSVANPSVTAQLPRGFATYLVVSDEMCSCGLFEEERPSREKEAFERLRRKYEAKGWSQSRMERAISQHFSDTGAVGPGLSADLVAFFGDVAERAGELQIVVHWYDGDVEKEEVVVSQGPTISVEEFRETNPVTKTDVVYRVAAPVQRGYTARG